jgi:hypothetical protein
MPLHYAFDEVWRLMNGLKRPLTVADPVVRYICALVSELAYYHVPQFEIENKKRAQVIPCNAYQTLISRGTATNVTIYLGGMDIPQSFVVVDRGVIAVGILLRDVLFIGFRGTQFLFDWRTNLRCRLTNIGRTEFVGYRAPFVHLQGRYHRGFAEEAFRISTRILDALKEKNIQSVSQLVLTGHSLGGAVAAIAEPLLTIAPTSICLFAAPRYADIEAYFTNSAHPPTQVRRVGDIVPLVPPHVLGYADHPYEFHTRGQQFIDFRNGLHFPFLLWIWVTFAAKRLEPHSMEGYRHEVGSQAPGVFGAQLPLAPYERLIPSQVATPV